MTAPIRKSEKFGQPTEPSSQEMRRFWGIDRSIKKISTSQISDARARNDNTSSLSTSRPRSVYKDRGAIEPSNISAVNKNQITKTVERAQNESEGHSNRRNVPENEINRDTPSRKQVTKQLQALQLGDWRDEELHKFLFHGHSVNERDIQASILGPERRHLFHCRFVICKEGLEALLHLSKNAGLCACIGSISFGIHRLTNETMRNLRMHEYADRYTPKHLESQYEFTHSFEPMELLTSALDNLKMHNKRLIIGVVDERRWLESRRFSNKFCGIRLFGKRLLKLLVPDTVFTVGVIAGAVEKSRYPLRRLILQRGLVLRCSEHDKEDFQELLGLRLVETIGWTYFREV